MRRLLIVALVGLTLAGCVSYVAPGDRVLIHDMAGNAKAMWGRIDADANCPAYVKTWAGGNALGWANLDEWANGRGQVDANTMTPPR